MPKIERSALVGQPASRMFELVNDVAAYRRRFAWCQDARVIEEGPGHMIARLELRLGPLKTWFTTENLLERPARIDMRLREGPFRRLLGQWLFQPLDEHACRVSLTLDFEPSSSLLVPAMTVGFKGLADRMVDDFVRVATRGSD